MDIFEVVRRECVAAHVAPADKPGVIRMIAELCAGAQPLAGIAVDAIERGLLKRESLSSTGFGKGIAIPHCRLDDARDFVVGVVSVPSGVAFDSMDGRDVRLIVFILGPTEQSRDHLKTLATVSRVLSNADAVDELVAAEADEALYESFVRSLGGEPGTDAYDYGE